MAETRTGNLIRQYRKANKLTQKELADMADMAMGTIAQYERGLRDPKSSHLMRLASVLNVSPGDLLPFDDGSSSGVEGRDPIEDTIKWRRAESTLSQCQESFLEQTAELDSKLLISKILDSLSGLNQKGQWAVYQYAHDLFKIREYRK